MRNLTNSEIKGTVVVSKVTDETFTITGLDEWPTIGAGYKVRDVAGHYCLLPFKNLEMFQVVE